MAGFLLKLKAKNNKQVPKKQNVLSEKNEPSDEDRVHQINAFDSKGGQFNGKIVKKTKEQTPAIKLKLNKTLSTGKVSERIAMLSFGINKSETTEEHQTSKDETGDVVLINSDNDGEDATGEDYESIAVENFGAAMLRGMGWKGEKNVLGATKKETSKLIEHRKQGILLGIGAKPVETELMEDLRGNNATFQIPLKKKP